MEITTELIKALREETGAGVLDCRNTLIQTGGDLDKAAEILREKGIAKAEERAERETLEGTVELYSHGNGRIGVMVEVNCETDFVARSKDFRDFAHEISLQIAASSPHYIDDSDVPDSVMEEEVISVRDRYKAEGKPEVIIDKIVEGYIEKYKNDMVLLRQPYIRNEDITVRDLLMQKIAITGEKIIIRRFQRWELGEDIIV